MLSKADIIVNALLEAVIVPVRSAMHKDFWRDFANLPPEIKAVVHEKYHQWRADPASLNFEPKFRNIYVVEVTRKYHAICVVDGTPAAADVAWLRVLKYDEYMERLTGMRKRPRASR